MAHLDVIAGRVGSARTQGQNLYQNGGKRAIDLALALLLLPLFLPIIAVLWLLTRLQGSPGFFGHARIGRSGATFQCWKIRTMVPDAARQLSAYLKDNPDAAQEWAQTQKLRHDPRVTWLGQILRRTSLDELPQIWNVLRGEMSFVGPRPVTEEELQRYGPHRHAYLDLRPGITGLWQIEGRADGCYEERLRLDRAYAGRLGLARDLGLILRTAPVVLWPTGR